MASAAFRFAESGPNRAIRFARHHVAAECHIGELVIVNVSEAAHRARLGQCQIRRGYEN
jgi:hypothetical protein